MSLLRQMNVSVGEVIFETAVSYSFSELVPPFMLESVMFGVVSIASLLSIYSLLAIKKHDGRPWKLAIGVALVFAICVTHWGLQFRSMKSILSGSGLGVPLDELLLESGPLPELDQLVLVGETLVLEVFLPLVTETVLFGVATFLVLVAVYFMVQRTGRLNFVSFSLRLALFLMFAIALTHWSTVLVFWTTLSRGRGSFTPYNNRLLLTLFECWAELLAFNIALSDAIVLWRMCVLWRRQRYLIEISIVLVLATFAMSIANVTTSVRSVRQSGAKYTDINFMVSALPILGKASPFWIAELCLSWTTNVFATGMIAIKAWWHRTEISAHIRDGTRTTMAEKVMALLVESGSIYSCVWTAYLITSLALENSSSVTTLDYWDLAMAQITLIYPTTIIILVTIEKTHCDTEFTYGSSNPISFANASSLTATSAPRHHRIELAGPQRFDLVASRGRVTVVDIAPPACEDRSGTGVKTVSRSSSDREDLEKEFPGRSEPTVERREKLDKTAKPSRDTFDMYERPGEREGDQLCGAAV